MFHVSRTVAGQGRDIWPLLAFLLLVVIVPTTCVLWFMTEAARNERMAVRQKLMELYQGEIGRIQSALDSHWENAATALSQHMDMTAAERFAALVTNGLADSVIILDANRRPIYPDVLERGSEAERPEDGQWNRAGALEYRQNSLEAAAAA
jgi:hypothetical protein